MATLKTLTVYPSGYVIDDYAYASAENLENGYNSADNTTYATINLTTGASAETYIYYTFDLSAIPDSAAIISITCSAKSQISSSTSSHVAERTMQLYSGTTAKGSSVLINSRLTSSATEMTVGDWTADELKDCRLKLYAKRGNRNTSTTYYIKFYGATLTVKYAEPDIIPIVGNITVGGVAKTLAGGYVNIGGVWKTICKSYSNINGIWKPTYKAGEVTFTWKKYVVEQVVVSTTYSLDKANTYTFTWVNGGSTDGWSDYYANYISGYTLYSTQTFDKSSGEVSYTGGFAAPSNSNIATFCSDLKASLGAAADSAASAYRQYDKYVSGNIETFHVEIRVYTDNNGIEIYEKKVVANNTYSDAQGEYIEDVTSSDYNAYPENGVQDGYWYVRQ